LPSLNHFTIPVSVVISHILFSKSSSAAHAGAGQVTRKRIKLGDSTKRRRRVTGGLPVESFRTTVSGIAYSNMIAGHDRAAALAAPDEP